MSYASLEIEIYTMVREILLGSKFGDILGQIQDFFFSYYHKHYFFIYKNHRNNIDLF